MIECECDKEDSEESPDGDIGYDGTETGAFDEVYREVALNCIRFLDYKSLEEVDRLTIAEYKLLMEGVRLREIDKDYRNHLQVFLNFFVRSERKAGKGKSKPVYTKFKQFYDYEKELEKVNKKKKSRFEGIGKLLAKER